MVHISFPIFKCVWKVKPSNIYPLQWITYSRNVYIKYFFFKWFKSISWYLVHLKSGSSSIFHSDHLSAYYIFIHTIFHLRMSRGYDVVLWIDSYDVTKASYIRHTSQYLVDSAHAALLETHQAVPFSCSICYLVKIQWNITVMHIELEFYKLSIYMTLPIHSTECYKAWN